MELAMVPVAQFAFTFAIYKLQRTQEKKLPKRYITSRTMRPCLDSYVNKPPELTFSGSY